MPFIRIRGQRTGSSAPVLDIPLSSYYTTPQLVRFRTKYILLFNPSTAVTEAQLVAAESGVVSVQAGLWVRELLGMEMPA